MQRLTAFTVGGAVAGAFGYVSLHQDLYKSTVKIEQSISGIRIDVVEKNAKLRQRIAMLEEEVAVLKASRKA